MKAIWEKTPTISKISLAVSIVALTVSLLRVILG